MGNYGPEKTSVSAAFHVVAETTLHDGITIKMLSLPLREKCPYSEFFWFVVSPIQTELGEIRSISPYLVRMWENTGQRISEYGRFLRSVPLYYLTNTAQEIKLTLRVSSINLTNPLENADLVTYTE